MREKLPDRPLKITGSLKVKAPNGFTKSNLPVTMGTITAENDAPVEGAVEGGVLTYTENDGAVAVTSTITVRPYGSISNRDEGM